MDLADEFWFAGGGCVKTFNVEQITEQHELFKHLSIVVGDKHCIRKSAGGTADVDAWRRHALERSYSGQHTTNHLPESLIITRFPSHG